MEEYSQNEVIELSQESSKTYKDPFNEVEVNVVFSRGGQIWRVPAFWAGKQVWKVRFAPPQTGTYSYRWECSDKTNKDLNGLEGAFSVSSLQNYLSLYL